MSDLKRLRETHATELEGLLLQSVRGDTPPPSARARTLAAVALGAAAGGAAVGTAGSAAAAASSGSTVAWAVAAKWLVIGAGAGVVVAGTLVGPLRGVVEGASRAQHADSTPVVTQRPRTVALSPVSGWSAAAETPVLELPGPSLEARSAAGRSAPAEHAAPAVLLAPGRVPEAAPSVANPVPITNTLPEEVAFLDTASRALREHDPSRAHAALDAYAARFGGGNLGPEATALRIQAFLEQGDHARAGRIAETFLAQNPHSPHAARVRSLLGIRLTP